LAFLNPAVRRKPFAAACARLGVGRLGEVLEKRPDALAPILASAEAALFDPAAGESVVDLPLAGTLCRGPAVVGDRLLVSVEGGPVGSRLACVDLPTGRVEATADFPGFAEWAIVTGGGSVFVASRGTAEEAGDLRAFRFPDLAPLWDFDALARIAAAPVVDGAARFVYVVDGSFLYRLCVGRGRQDGHRLREDLGEWKLAVAGARAAPAIAGDRVWLAHVASEVRVGADFGRPALLSLDAASPDRAVDVAVLHPSRFQPFNHVRLVQVGLRPDLLLFAFDSELHGAPLSGGERAWSVSLPEKLGAVVLDAGANVYLSDRSRRILVMPLAPSAP
jgi:hypothetical protein